MHTLIPSQPWFDVAIKHEFVQFSECILIGQFLKTDNKMSPVPEEEYKELAKYLCHHKMRIYVQCL